MREMRLFSVTVALNKPVPVAADDDYDDDYEGPVGASGLFTFRIGPKKTENNKAAFTVAATSYDRLLALIQERMVAIVESTEGECDPFIYSITDGGKVYVE